MTLSDTEPELPAAPATAPDVGAPDAPPGPAPAAAESEADPEADPGGSPLPPPHLPGDVICLPEATEFELGPELGRGGMGVVLEARQRSLDRTVALKTLHPTLDTPDHLARFGAEARILGGLEHPNILPVHAYGRDGAGRPYLAMKVVRGASWWELLHPHGEAQRRRAAACDLREHLRILQRVCEAVGFAHAHGVIHRDLKPANVLVGEFNEVLLTDWGLALELAARPAPGEQDPEPAGTPAYFPPELACGDEAAQGPWTDVYLLGALLYEVLTGTQPHRGPTLEDFCRQAQAPVQPASARAGEQRPVPAGLSRIAERALDPDPTRRFGSPAELSEALDTHLREAAVEALLEPARQSLARCAARVQEPQAPVAECYTQLAAVCAELEQVQALFPESDAAAAGAAGAHLVHARFATDQGDVAAAEVQLASCDPALPEVSALRARLDALRTAQRLEQRRRRRNRALLGAVLTLALAGGGLGVWGLRQSSAAHQATVRRQQAQAAVEGASWVAYDEQVKAYERAVALDPGWVGAFSELSAARIRQALALSESDPAACAESLQRAREANARALALAPDDPSATYYRGYTAQMLGEPELRWAVDYRRAAALAPDRRDGLSAATALALVQGRFAEAERLASRAIAAQGDEDDLIQRALARFVLGDLDGGLADVAAAMVKLPAQHDYDALTALFLLAQGQERAAAGQLLASVDQHSRVPHGLPLLAYLAARRGDVELTAALGSYARSERAAFARCFPTPLYRVLAQAPPPRDVLGRAFVLEQDLARVTPAAAGPGVRLRREGEGTLAANPAAALALAEQALALDATDGPARLLEGRSLLALGHPDAARRELRRVPLLSPEHAQQALELLAGLQGGE